MQAIIMTKHECIQCKSLSVAFTFDVTHHVILDTCMMTLHNVVVFQEQLELELQQDMPQ